MNFYWIEVKRFIQKYGKIIVLSAIVFGVVFASLMFFRNDEPRLEDPAVKENTEIFEGDSMPAYFRFYIEQLDGYTYTNGKTVHELFNLPNMIELASMEIGNNLLEIQQTVQQTTEKEEFTPVTVEIDSSSNLFTATFTTGDNRDNLRLAEFYYDYLFNEGFEILENNIVYSIEEPQLVGSRLLIEPSETEAEMQATEFSLIDGLIDAVIGAILGFILSVIFVIGKEFFSKKLNYSFTYTTGNPDNFMLYEEDDSNKHLLEKFIGLPLVSSKIMVSQLDARNKIALLSTESKDFKAKQVSSLSELPLALKVDEIIIIVQANQTDRKWYNEQLEFSKMHKVPVKIIQINEIV